ncbi:MAG: hypothetical protein OQK82_07260 [Candidatus Pacearchaeota archaeon]|nr:hypothetical protein [Candidatus Pacearchaeota archaeon]
MDTKKIAFLNILVALVFALAIIFLDVSETIRNWMIVLWFVISSLISVIEIRKQK